MQRLLVIVTLLLVPSAAMAQATGAYLADLTWPEAEARLARAPVVVLPFGPGAKEHGPHLPLNADAKVMEYLCRQAVDAPDKVTRLLLPASAGWRKGRVPL